MMTDYLESDEPREAALRAAVDFSAAVVGGGATKEELVAALEAVRQIPIDLERMTNALHVPSDAGEYEDTLRVLLERIRPLLGLGQDCSLASSERGQNTRGLSRKDQHELAQQAGSSPVPTISIERSARRIAVFALLQ